MKTRLTRISRLVSTSFLLLFTTVALAQPYPNPYRSVEGWEMGIRIGDANLGWVYYFVQLPYGDPRSTAGNGAEFVAVDAAGNMYGGEPSPRRLQKYVRARP